jgi:hypothetical protein
VCEIDLYKYIAISVVVFLCRFVLRTQFFCKEDFEKMCRDFFLVYFLLVFVTGE